MHGIAHPQIPVFQCIETLIQSAVLFKQALFKHDALDRDIIMMTEHDLVKSLMMDALVILELIVVR